MQDGLGEDLTRGGDNLNEQAIERIETMEETEIKSLLGEILGQEFSIGSTGEICYKEDEILLLDWQRKFIEAAQRRLRQICSSK